MLTRLAIVTAPALFVLLWSTGFIGARYAAASAFDPKLILNVPHAITSIMSPGNQRDTIDTCCLAFIQSK
jgi:hypothetical protein